jgi:FixJ family two-component response regulator
MSLEIPIVAVVEDDSSLLRSLGAVLTAYGYRARLFNSPQQYLASGEACTDSCVVIDVELGCDMSGFDLGQAILTSGYGVPLIFMTGSADPDFRLRALELDCVAFLEKPFEALTLVGAIEKARAPGRRPS